MYSMCSFIFSSTNYEYESATFWIRYIHVVFSHRCVKVNKRSKTA